MSGMANIGGAARRMPRIVSVRLGETTYSRAVDPLPRFEADIWVS